MPRRPRPLPGSLPWKVFTAAEARAAGVLPGRLRGRDIARIDRGLYGRLDLPGSPSDVPGQSTRAKGSAGSTVRHAPSPAVDDPTTLAETPDPAAPCSPASLQIREEDVIRALQRADPDALVSGISAARLWGLPLPLEKERWDADDPGTTTTMSLAGFHRVAKGRVTWRSGEITGPDRAVLREIAMTSRLRTFVDLGTSLPVDDLIAIGDHLVRTPRPSLEGRAVPYVPLDTLRTAVRSFRGRGARRLQAVVDQVRVSADSPAETSLRLALSRKGLPDAVLNGTLRSEDGTWLGEPDMAWPAWRVCVEYDGRHHRTAAQQAKDVQRGERRRVAGWVELIITAADMKEGAESAIQRVRDELRRHGWDG